MAKKKACKKCKFFVDGPECPVCKGNVFSTSWQGRIAFLDAKKSSIAEKMGVTDSGEYAIKIR